MKILLWEQHLSRGTGHFSRTAEIARELCKKHDVYLLAGGRPVTLKVLPPEIEIIQLPVLEERHKAEDYAEREENIDAYSSVDGRDIRTVLDERSQIVRNAAEKIAPDVFMCEYFPFARTFLEAEVVAAVQSVKAHGGLALSSVREILQGDLKAKTRNDPQNTRLAQRIAFHEHTLNLLNNHFDALLVHGDEHFIALEKTVPAWILEKIRVPVTYTGYVSEPLPEADECPDEIHDLIAQGGFVVVSVGGGGSRNVDPFKPGAAVIYNAINAWWQLVERGRVADRQMVLFIAENSTEDDLQQVRQACAGGPFIIHRARPDFLHWLQAADLSISRSGYNTCTNLLATRVPAILLPNRKIADQEFRTQELAARGLISAALFEKNLSPQSLAAAIEKALAQVPICHSIALDGAQRTAAIIAQLEVLRDQRRKIAD